MCAWIDLQLATKIIYIADNFAFDRGGRKPVMTSSVLLESNDNILVDLLERQQRVQGRSGYMINAEACVGAAVL